MCKNKLIFCLQALSKALADVRSEMVRSAAENVKDRARSNEDSLNVQQIVEKQNKDLQVIEFGAI